MASGLSTKTMNTITQRSSGTCMNEDLLTHHILVCEQALLKGEERLIGMLAPPLAMSMKFISFINPLCIASPKKMLLFEWMGVKLVGLLSMLGQGWLLSSVGSGGLCLRWPLWLAHCVLQTLDVTLPGRGPGCRS